MTLEQRKKIKRLNKIIDMKNSELKRIERRLKVYNEKFKKKLWVDDFKRAIFEDDIDKLALEVFGKQGSVK